MKRILSIMLALMLVLGAVPVLADTAKTPIIGKPTTTVKQMETWAKAKKADPDFIKQAKTFYDISVKYGIDPAVTYAQSAKETNFFKFTGVVSKDHFNPCGLKITVGGSDTDKQAHKKFKDWNEGITAQVHHLALYAGHKDFPYDADKTPDPRHFPSIYGKAPYVEDLGARWAPSKTYGWETAIMMYDLTTALVDGVDPIPGPNVKPVIPEELLKPVLPNPEEPNEPVKPEKPTEPDEPVYITVPRPMQRIFGVDRITTAIRVSKEIVDKSNEVIIASSTSYADALVAASYSRSGDSYIPILLNGRDSLNPEVKSEILRLGASRVYIIGGSTVISQKVMSEIAALGGDGVGKVTAVRISGSDRYDTANMIADKTGNKNRFILANGNTFADALSVSAYSAQTKIPILLTNGNTLDPKTEKRLNAADEVIIIGGINSVSGPIGDKLRENGVTVSRISGRDRIDTAVEVSKKLFPKNKVFIVTDAYNYPDSLVGAPLAAKYGGTILLTNSKTLSSAVDGYLNAVRPTNIIALGGNNSISASVYNALDMKIK